MALSALRRLGKKKEEDYSWLIPEHASYYAEGNDGDEGELTTKKTTTTLNKKCVFCGATSTGNPIHTEPCECCSKEVCHGCNDRISALDARRSKHHRSSTVEGRSGNTSSVLSAPRTLPPSKASYRTKMARLHWRRTYRRKLSSIPENEVVMWTPPVYARVTAALGGEPSRSGKRRMSTLLVDAVRDRVNVFRNLIRSAIPRFSRQTGYI